MTIIKNFIKQNIVLSIAILAALITSFFVRPDANYLYYPDYRTLSCLFLTLAVICALKDINFFSIIANRIVMVTGNLKLLTLALVYITFIGSMLIANDMALLTFLPLGYFSLSSTKNEKYMAYIFILQNISCKFRWNAYTIWQSSKSIYLFSI